MVLLNDQRLGAFTTGVGGDGSDGRYSAQDVTQTVLYRWQGALVPVQTIQTDGATSATAFEIQGFNYLFITNFGADTRHNTKSRLYRVNNDGHLLLVSMVYELLHFINVR